MLASCAGHYIPDYWSKRIAKRASLRNNNPEESTPHTCQHCQKLVIDVSEPANPWLIHQGMANPKGIDFNCSVRDIEEGALNGCPLMTQLHAETQIPTEEEQRKGFFRLVAHTTMRDDVNGFELTGLSGLHLSNIQRPWEDWRKEPYRKELPSIQDIYFDVHAEPGKQQRSHRSRIRTG